MKLTDMPYLTEAAAVVAVTFSYSNVVAMIAILLSSTVVVAESMYCQCLVGEVTGQIDCQVAV